MAFHAIDPGSILGGDQFFNLRTFSDGGSERGAIIFSNAPILFIISLIYTVRPNKKETRFISEISSLPRKIETNCMLHYQEHIFLFQLIPNT